MPTELRMPKERASITIRKEFMEWIDRKMEDLTCASRSHAIEALVAQAIQSEKREWS